VSAAEDLLTHYQHLIEELRFVMGSNGVFDVVVDGVVIYSKAVEGRHAHPGEVLDRFRRILPAGTREYGT
jgi:predicted Rdx family selenoprotein